MEIEKLIKSAIAKKVEVTLVSNYGGLEQTHEHFQPYLLLSNSSGNEFFWGKFRGKADTRKFNCGYFTAIRLTRTTFKIDPALKYFPLPGETPETIAAGFENIQQKPVKKPRARRAEKVVRVKLQTATKEVLQEALLTCRQELADAQQEIEGLKAEIERLTREKK